MESLTSNHVQNFLNNIMVGVNRHPWLLSGNKIQSQNPILLNYHSIWLLSIRHFLQILLLIFHARDEVQKIEYRPNCLPLGTQFKLH